MSPFGDGYSSGNALSALGRVTGVAGWRCPGVSSLKRLSPCDLVLVEGYKRAPIPKLEIYRADVGKPLLHPGDPFIIGLATDTPGAAEGRDLPVFALDAYDVLATFVEERAVYADVPD